MRWTLQTFIDSNCWAWVVQKGWSSDTLNKSNNHTWMTLLSFGDFYLGIDKRCFSNLSIHLWKIELEWGGPRPTAHGPTQGCSYRSEFPSDFQGDWTCSILVTRGEHATASAASIPICLLSRQMSQDKDGARPRTQRCFWQSECWLPVCAK